MDLATLKGTLLTWVRRETRITVIFARQDKPRPKFPYATIYAPNPAIRVGAIDEIRPNDDDTGYEQHGLRTTTVSLNIYGDDANDLMSRLRDSLDWPLTQEEFATAGLALVGETGPKDLSAFEDTKHVERSQLDLVFMYGITRSPDEDRDVGQIATVELTREDLPEDGDSETFTVGTTP